MVYNYILHTLDFYTHKPIGIPKGSNLLLGSNPQKSHSALSDALNPLTPNDPYSGHTAPLTSKRCILYTYSTNTGTEYFKQCIYSPFFFKM